MVQKNIQKWTRRIFLFFSKSIFHLIFVEEKGKFKVGESHVSIFYKR